MSAITPDRSPAARSASSIAVRLAGGLDYPLIAILATLLAVGLIEVWSASMQRAGTHYFVTQIGWVLAGLGVMLVMMLVPYRTWQRLAVPIMAVTLILLIAVLVFGQELLGAKRTLFGGHLQPSEFAKLAVVIYVAAWVASKKKHLRDVKAGLIPFAIVMGVVCALIVLEKSFSVTIIILVIGITIFFLGGGDIKQLLITAAIATVVLLLLIYQFHYGVDRINEWLMAIKDPDNAPYNVAQVHEIIRRGGGIGTRPENWLQKGAVSLLWSDYLFANLAADTRFLGAVSVVVLFAALAYRGLSVALRAPDQFGALAGVGVTTWLLTQAVIHMGTSVALIPATGIPLPFMSYGGSAMLACMAGMGLLLSISRASVEKKPGYEIPSIGRGDGRPRVSDPGRGTRADPNRPKTREPEPKRNSSQRAPGKPAAGQRKPVAGRWRPNVKEEEYTVDNDWRSRIDDQTLPRRRGIGRGADNKRR